MVLPHPVTKYVTVRKSMTNLKSVRVQLNQDLMPIFCDEFDIIMLNEPDFLRTFFLMLENLHLIKVLINLPAREIPHWKWCRQCTI